MIEKVATLPFYARVTIVLLGLIALVTVMYVTKGILVPLVFSIIIAILLNPVVKFFVRLRFNRIVAIIITLLLTILAIAAFGLLFFSQISRFLDSWPVIVEKFTEMINESISWAAGYFDIEPTKLHNWVIDTAGSILNMGTGSIGKTLLNVGNLLFIMLLIPVYLFMILFYKPLLLEFIRKLFAKQDQSKVQEIVTQTKSTVQQYLVGLMIESAIIAVLYIITLLSLGIEYAIVLGIIAALLNVIPYIGGLVGVALPMIVALATKSTAWYSLYVLIIFYVIQLIDNNYIVPKIVASKVKLNALITLLAVIAGNALWGISGMFLSIPLLAIVKLIFDRIDSLKPWGYLLGDDMPVNEKHKPFRFRRN